MNTVPVIVAYKPPRKNAKVKIERFPGITVDEILSLTKRKPLIPYECDILRIGIGEVFEQKYKEEFGVK